MNKTNTSKRSNRNTKTHKSLKGKWGRIGAPPKPMKFPNRPFVMATLFSLNKNLCELTIRKNVDKALADGTLVELTPVPQKGGAVGRPKSCFVLKSKFDASKMTLRPAKTVTTPVATVVPAPVADDAPAPVPVVKTVTETASATPEPVVEAPASPVIADGAVAVSDIPATSAVETPVVSY